MVVGEDGRVALPWLAAPLAEALASHRGHALMVHAAAGTGALAFGLTLAQAWLCESAGDIRPCGRCGSCRLVQSHLHPDLRVLLPETLRREHEWPLADDKGEGEDSKRKPSRQIRIDEVRGLIDWATRTSGRGRGKVAVLHPAEALNVQAASALLKTLEEPPVGTRLILTTADPALLLPTVRSRCQPLRVAEPPADLALAWLDAQGIAQPQVLLAATAGRPLDALALAQAGITGDTWAALPAAVARGQSVAFAGWPVPLALDALQKFCHDALARATGGVARYFPDEGVPAKGSLEALSAWSRELARVARHDEHPWNEGLLLDSLVKGGAQAFTPRPAHRAVARRGLDTLPS
ncbi:MAG: DNA polymerase III subunit delta' [Rubrivivax sp.]|nr:DNA polymerase III subunit delta' [Rubrivivax sp.]